MPTKFQVVAGVFATVAACDLVTRPLRNNKLLMSKTIIRLHEENESLHAQIGYLVNVLNENEVRLDEFDLIILPNVVRKS